MAIASTDAGAPYGPTPRHQSGATAEHAACRSPAQETSRAATASPPFPSFASPAAPRSRRTTSNHRRRCEPSDPIVSQRDPPEQDSARHAQHGVPATSTQRRTTCPPAAALSASRGGNADTPSFAMRQGALVPQDSRDSGDETRCDLSHPPRYRAIINGFERATSRRRAAAQETCPRLCLAGAGAQPRYSETTARQRRHVAPHTAGPWHGCDQGRARCPIKHCSPSDPQAARWEALVVQRRINPGGASGRELSDIPRVSDFRRQGRLRASSGRAATDPVPQDRLVGPRANDRDVI